MPHDRDLKLTRSQDGPRRRAPRSGITASLAGVLIMALAALFPIGYAAVRTIVWCIRASEGRVPGPTELTLVPPWIVLARTLGYVGLISLLSTALALPGALVLARGGRAARWLAPLIAVPLFMPSYLAYAGWGLLRAPRTWLGNWLSSGPNHVVELKFLIANHAMAIWGLALWSFPIAAYVMAMYFRSIPADTIDAARLDAPPRSSRPSPAAVARYASFRFRLLVPGLASAAALVALVMLGSVVPLDVAQVNTYSIRLLRRVTESQYIESAWAFAWPMYAIAIAAAMVVTRRLCGEHGLDPARERVAAPRPGAGLRPIALSVLILLAATLVPVTMYLSHLRGVGDAASWSRVLDQSKAFWRDARPGVFTSARVGAVAALVGVALTIAVWRIVSSAPASGRSAGMRVLRGLTVVFLIGALLPGVFVGSSTASAWTALAPYVRPRPGWLLVVLAHVARFGAVGVLLGWWVAARELPAVRDLRRLDGAMTGRAWWLAVGAARWPVALAAGVAVFALSLHEIEATVLVQPPGPQALSQSLLAALHFARDDYLAAAVVNLLALTGLLGMGVSGLYMSAARK
ncbi:MAG: hypothetical protein AB7G11_14675 [Phycisphaerales bacterium]